MQRLESQRHKAVYFEPNPEVDGADGTSIATFSLLGVRQDINKINKNKVTTNTGPHK